MTHAVPPPGDAPPTAAPSPPRGRAERALVLAAFAALLLVRLADVRAVKIDSDEPQHLHVAWAWLHGLVPYRDVFDNHTPLFQWLCAPFLAAVGERADVVLLARLLMFPLFAATLGLAASIGSSLFGRRAGTYGALLLGLWSEFFVPTLQFRTDDLWLVLWLAFLAILLRGTFTAKRALGAGLVLGAALSTSLKTGWLGATAALGWAVAAWATRTARRPSPAALRRSLVLLAGALVVPGAFVAWFARQGALASMAHLTLVHNGIRPPYGHEPWKPWLFGALLAGLPFAARAVALRGPSGFRSPRALGWLLHGGFSTALLYTVWPTQTSQDALPVLVVGATALAALVVPAADRLARRLAPAAPARREGIRIALCGALAALFAVRLVTLAPPWRDRTSDVVRDYREILRISDPDDFVMDAKGGTIYRPRPFFWAMELFTRLRIQRGEIVDDVPARLVATRTGYEFGGIAGVTAPTRRFLDANYLGVGRVRVAGRALPAASPGEQVSFDIAIPGRYALVSQAGPVEGVLDGVRYAGPRDLEAGPHRFVPSRPLGPAAFAWAKAIERGFDPFRGPRE